MMSFICDFPITASLLLAYSIEYSGTKGQLPLTSGLHWKKWTSNSGLPLFQAMTFTFTLPA